PQQIRAWHCVYRIQKDISFRATSDKLPKMHIILKNDRRIHINGMEDIYMCQGQFNIMFAPDGQYTNFYRKGKDYISLDISYSITFLQQWQPYFPRLDEFMRKVDEKKPAWLFEQSREV